MSLATRNLYQGVGKRGRWGSGRIGEAKASWRRQEVLLPPTVLPAYTTAAKGTLSAPLLLYVHRLRLHGPGRGGWRERIQVQQSAQRKKKDYSYAVPCFGFFLAAEKNALRLQRKGCRMLCSRRETAARKRLLRVNAHGQLLSSPACKKGGNGSTSWGGRVQNNSEREIVETIHSSAINVSPLGASTQTNLEEADETGLEQGDFLLRSFLWTWKFCSETRSKREGN